MLSKLKKYIYLTHPGTYNYAKPNEEMQFLLNSLRKLTEDLFTSNHIKLRISHYRNVNLS